MSNAPINPEISAVDYQPLSGNGGENLSNGATPNAKGSWTEIEDSTLIDADGFMMMLRVGYDSGDHGVMFDIGLGSAGNEEVIVADWMAHTESVGVHQTFDFPIPIPKGTRVSARMQGDGASVVNCKMGLGFYSNTQHKSGLWAGADVNIGKDTANTVGTDVAPGAGFGSWVELESSLSDDIIGFFVHYGHSNGSISDSLGVYQIGIGSAGNEVVIFEHAYWRDDGTAKGGSDVFIGIPIAAGARISIRVDDFAGDTLDWSMTGIRA